MQAGDESAIDQIYQPSRKLLDDYPKARECVAFAKDAAQVARLSAAVAERQRREVLAAVRETLGRAPGVAGQSSQRQGFAAAVNTWRQRLLACDLVLGMLQQSCPDAAALEAAWKRLESVGVPPEAEPYRAQVQQMLARQRAWAEFGKVPDELSEQADARLVAAWKEPLFAGWAEAERQRPRVEQARQRLSLLQRLPADACQAAVGRRR